MFSKFFRIAIDSPLRRNFDYLPPVDFTNEQAQKLQAGMRVCVPFGRREVIGIFLEYVDHTEIEPAKLKRVLDILDDVPLLPESIFKLCVWASEYYHHSLGDVLIGGLPKLLRNGAPATTEGNQSRKSKYVNKNSFKINELIKKTLGIDPILELNQDQQNAFEQILQNQNSATVFLLDGVTGSGKTEVYLRAMEVILQARKQILVLVPEISLTPQTLTRFKKRFPDENITVFHSRLSDRERLFTWLAAKEGKSNIILGTRSALFIPLARPGMLILDEEHDLSFKQQSGLRYSARDLAVVRSKFEKIPLILGSATPSLESLENAKKGRYKHLCLPERVGGALLPIFHLIDLRKQRLKYGLSKNVIAVIEEHLKKDGQVLIFVNRRGYAPTLLCHQCGFVATCENCDVRLTLHQKAQYLRCHHCDNKTKIPDTCPKCGAKDLMPCGIGTERLEIGMQKLFPHVSVARIDSDTTSKKGSLQKALEDIHTGDSKILIGTQILTKGHHFPNVTLVIILNADGGLFSADFRSSEYLAQLIMQVSGRAGRESKPGEVYIQTHNPEHPLLLSLINMGFEGFARNSLKERKEAFLPPFAYLALIRAEGKNRDYVRGFLQKIKNYSTHSELSNFVSLLGPISPVIERKAGNYCAQLLLQSTARRQLHSMIEFLLACIDQLPEAKKVKWYLEVDPVDNM